MFRLVGNTRLFWDVNLHGWYHYWFIIESVLRCVGKYLISRGTFYKEKCRAPWSS